MPHYSVDKPVPAQWSVKQGLTSYLEENGFSREEYDLPVVKVTFWGITFPVPNPPQRQIAVRFHDLHHLVTGYGTDPTGEAEISAWEMRRGVSVFGLYVQGIVFVGMLMGFVHSPRRTLRAWQTAKSKTPLVPTTMDRYQELLKLSVGELRQLYDVPQGALADKPRRLHDKAPQVNTESK